MTQLGLLDTAPPAPPPALPLRPYQEEALAAVEAAPGRGVTRPVVVLPTGTGKTVVFAHLARRRPGRTLVLAHRDELIGQAASKLRAIVPGADVGIVKAESDQHARALVVASVQTLARPGRLARLRPDFGTLIVDECHHAASASYRTVLRHLRAFDPNGPLTVGFTETPDRGDGVGLDAVLQEIVYRKDLLEMIEAGYLCDLRAVQVRLAADFGRVPTRGGDLADDESGRVLLAADAPVHAVEAYLAHGEGRTTLVFTPTVAVATAMADAFRAAGVPAAWLSGATPLEERRRVLRGLGDGTIRVVANCGVLTEGFDEPRVACVILARPTKSRSLYVQMIGRATRLYPGKADALILDFVGAAGRHDVLALPDLFGLPLDALKERSVTEAVAMAREVATDDPAWQLPMGRVVAEAVDLFRGRRARWVPAEGGRFVLPLEAGFLALEGAGDTWAVVERQRGQDPTVLASGLDLGYAQGFAEDRARQAGAGALIKADAPWRAQPATERQRAALGRWRIPVAEGLTRGEASDLITAAMAAKG